MITSQFIENGRCRQVDIVKAFGVSAVSVKRYVKKYRQGGVKSFYQPRATRGAHVLTPEVLHEAQDLLNTGFPLLGSGGPTGDEAGHPVDYETTLPDETLKVVNPDSRKLEGQIKKAAGKKSRKEAEFGALTLYKPSEEKEIEQYEAKKGELIEEIDQLKTELKDLKTRRQKTAKHIAFVELSEEDRFTQLAPPRKQFMDTIRMIAYRAETAGVSGVREVLSRPDDARSLIREIFTTEDGLIPNEEEETLTIRLHHLTNRLSDEAARHLAAH